MSISIGLRSNIPDLVMIGKQAFRASVKEFSNEILEEVKSRTPVDTGRLRSSLTLSFEEHDDSMIAKIESLAYALILEEGASPHTISANKAKALHFFVDNKEIFAKSVRHPGIQGRFFIKASIDKTLPKFASIFARDLEGL